MNPRSAIISLIFLGGGLFFIAADPKPKEPVASGSAPDCKEPPTYLKLTPVASWPFEAKNQPFPNVDRNKKGHSKVEPLTHLEFIAALQGLQPTEEDLAKSNNKIDQDLLKNYVIATSDSMDAQRIRCTIEAFSSEKTLLPKTTRVELKGRELNLDKLSQLLEGSHGKILASYGKQFQVQVNWEDLPSLASSSEVEQISLSQKAMAIGEVKPVDE